MYIKAHQLKAFNHLILKESYSYLKAQTKQRHKTSGLFLHHSLNLFEKLQLQLFLTYRSNSG